MSSDGERRPMLLGWKEIAEFLRIEKTTAQRWAKSRGLPIKYIPGGSNRVTADAAELDAWLACGPSPNSDLATSAVQPSITRRSWIGKGAIPSTVPIAGDTLATYCARTLRDPAAVRIEGATLIVVAADGRELWRHTFPKPIRVDPLRLDLSAEFCDLEGDGLTEVLFRYVTPDVLRSSLVCFNSNGTVRWTFQPGKDVSDSLGRTFTPPYAVQAVSIVTPQGSKQSLVAVSSVHNWSFPSQVALLDSATGQLTAEFWHRGHLYHMASADLDGDGNLEILLGGVNDAREFQCASLLVFDHRRVSGASCDPSGRSYFSGMAPGSAKRTLYFPRTDVCLDEEFNWIQELQRSGNRRWRVTVGEAPGPSPAYVTYELDDALRPLNAAISPNLVKTYRNWQDAGKLPRELPEEIAARLMTNIRMVSGA